MFRVGDIKIKNAVLLAPMEDVTDISFRLICRELGADIVYTEFVNSEGLIRGSEKTHRKLRLIPEERPAGIQIYGGNLDSMVAAARIAEEENPDLIDINAGCWVKNVVGCGAGAGLLKDPEYMQKLVAEVVKSVSIPVTVKTRIGWDSSSITILEIARRLEDVGVQALTIHGRTRAMGHKGDPDFSWMEELRKTVSMPIALNGGMMTAQEAVNVLRDTGADAIMIARGAIGNPWIFSDIKAILNGRVPASDATFDLKIRTILRHLELAVSVKGERRAVLEHRKFYSGYLKNLHNASKTRTALMQAITFEEVKEILFRYHDELAAIVNDETVFAGHSGNLN